VLLHGWATPLFEAPDEVWHYAYIRWLAEGHGLPPMDSDVSGAGQEVAQPPLYYSIAALLSAPFPDDDLESLFWHNPNFGYQASGIEPDNKNWLIHTEHEHFPWQGSVLTVHVTRLTSLIFGLVTVAASWGLGYETFGDQRGALFTAALVAFQPQFVFISSVLSNDSAAAALSALSLWLAVRMLRKGVTLRRTLLTGAVVGLAILTKTSALLLIPLVGLALPWAVWHEHHSWKQLVVPLSLYATVVLALGSWWYLRNYVLYGDLLGISSHINTPWGRPETIPLVELLPELPLLIRSFWGAYGWGHVFWPDPVYILLTLGTLFYVTRALYTAIRTQCWSAITRDTLFLAISWLVLIVAALLRWMQQVEAPHGRLLFPALSAWALILAAGMRSRQKSEWIGRGFLMSMAVLTMLAPGARILATFTPPRLRAPEAVMSQIQPVDLTYGGSARLLGVNVEPKRVLAGEDLHVEACWEAISPMKKDYSVFVQVLGPENVQIASRRTYPGLGRFPTSLWPEGRAFCDTYRMEIAAWAEAPLRYQIEVGLFNAESMERLPVVNANGTTVNVPIVDNVIVEPTDDEERPDQKAIAHLGEDIALQSYNVSPTVQAGEILTVTLEWEALTQIKSDRIAFVHLWSPGASKPLTQSDAPPRNGWYPTSVWQAGDRVPDTHRLRLPPDLAPGHYPLWAGMYRPEDGTRLPAFGPKGRYPNDLIPLGEVIIE
jgi:4-amino-4-deoxy-L-arabinose transferase-like glycosyltransferase